MSQDFNELSEGSQRHLMVGSDLQHEAPFQSAY